MKTLIICCDGTWNTADQDYPTNVSKIRDALKPKYPLGKNLHYDEGVGTGTIPFIERTNPLDRFLGGAVGLGLNANVKEAYRFLCDRYETGDHIFLFGFSRGAYTVRSLAGLVTSIGLAHSGSSEQTINAIYEIYRKYKAEKRAKPLRKLEGLLTGPVPITFLGVWDTVGAMGIPIGGLRWIGRSWYDFHDVKLNPRVLNARHALAVVCHRIWRKAGLGGIFRDYAETPENVGLMT